jgi:hypothetical protein
MYYRPSGCAQIGFHLQEVRFADAWLAGQQQQWRAFACQMTLPQGQVVTAAD